MKKFLIIKIGAIGDAVMVLPMVQKIRKDHPSSHITWVGGKIIRKLIEKTNLINSYISIEETNLYSSSFISKIFILFKTWKSLFLKRYDAIYILHSDKRYKILSWFCRSKKRPVSCQKHLKLDLYHAFGYLKTYTPIQYPAKDLISYPRLDFSSSFWKTHRLHQKINTNTLLLCPGGAKNTFREQSLKRWPILHYVTLAKILIDHGWNIALIGGKTDQWTLSYFEEIQYENLIGQTSLVELCYAISLAGGLMTHDTGPMHLSKLTMTPTFVIFGPTSEKTFISKKSHIYPIFSTTNLHCRPCYNGRDFFPCTQNLCMSSVEPKQVFQIIQAKLKRKPNEIV